MTINRFARTRSNGAVNYTSTRGPIDQDHLRQIAPSVFAESAHGSRSEAYRYIPTSEILSGLGYIQRNAQGRRVARRRTREVNGIDQNTGLNRALWTLAEEMKKIKSN